MEDFWSWIAAALLLGVAFANIFKGLPLDKEGVLQGNLFTLLNPYALVVGLKRRYPAGRFAGVQRILGEDLGLIAEAEGNKREAAGHYREGIRNVPDSAALHNQWAWLYGKHAKDTKGRAKGLALARKAHDRRVEAAR